MNLLTAKLDYRRGPQTLTPSAQRDLGRAMESRSPPSGKKPCSMFIILPHSSQGTEICQGIFLAKVSSHGTDSGSLFKNGARWDATELLQSWGNKFNPGAMGKLDGEVDRHLPPWRGEQSHWGEQGGEASAAISGFTGQVNKTNISYGKCHGSDRTLHRTLREAEERHLDASAPSERTVENSCWEEFHPPATGNRTTV